MAHSARQLEATRRWKARNRDRVAETNRAWRERNPKQRDHAWEAANPEAHRAGMAVTWALRTGALVRPDGCEICDAGGLLHAHHPDYLVPLAVWWLCPSCHRTLHALQDRMTA
jgi:hypothetical protein